MPDIVTVSDSILNQSAKTRPITQSVIVSDGVVIAVVSHNFTRSLTEDRPVYDVLTLQTTRQRIISDTVVVSELIEAFKNGIPTSVPPPEIPTPQNIIGTRERAVRATRRAPRAIVIDEVKNTVIAPLKLLARLDNKAIVAIRPRPSLNVARLGVRLMYNTQSPNTITQSRISVLPRIAGRINAGLALLSSPSMWATGRLKTRPETQYIESFKAINADRIDKLHKLAMLSMMVESL
jgi:hypothetical protein